jgi:hypothetical protein
VGVRRLEDVQRPVDVDRERPPGVALALPAEQRREVDHPVGLEPGDDVEHVRRIGDVPSHEPVALADGFGDRGRLADVETGDLVTRVHQLDEDV